jgi:L-lactate dehydrogenase complex protein LldF
MTHAARAEAFQKDKSYAKWHDKALWFVREKRDKASNKLPEWESLRDAAAGIKKHTIENITHYLEAFENKAKENGIVVHWAKDGKEHNEIVYSILQKHNVKKVVKSKSMLTEECHLNPHLESKGIEVVDTDLGERIVQLRKEPPSHIVLPAIHLKREHVSDLFHEKMGTEKGNSEPEYLTEAARQSLRVDFLNADAAITGVNFAIAETGGFVVCTNEGNADLGASLPPVHIACMGLEKIIPKAKDLSVFLRLLARSATGQAITTYSSHFHGAKENGEMHIVVVDNGRSKIIHQPEFLNSLRCIRCGACMNTCPIYRRSGGHSYQTVVPGPIGSVLAPHNSNEQHKTLPFASTLCGSCTDVCPVKINLHEQLLSWRSKLAKAGHIDSSKKFALGLTAKIFKSPTLYNLLGKIARKTVPLLPRFLIYSKLNVWGKQREIPQFPKESFKELMKKRNHK